jgi:hypothetical protein
MADGSTKAKIAHELYEAVRKLGAKSDLLSIIGSFGDTLNDEEVLEALRDWNHNYPDGEEGVYADGDATPSEEQEQLGPKPLPGIP